MIEHEWWPCDQCGRTFDGAIEGIYAYGPGQTVRVCSEACAVAFGPPQFVRNADGSSPFEPLNRLMRQLERARR